MLAPTLCGMPCLWDVPGVKCAVLNVRPEAALTSTLPAGLLKYKIHRLSAQFSHVFE